MLATLSTENKIIQRLTALGCSELSFSKLVAGIVGRSTVVKAFTGRGPFFPSVADRLLERLLEMEELTLAVTPIPIDWTRTTEVSNALLIRMTARAARDLGLDEPELQQASEWATKRVQESEAGGGE
jgi:hypothetical protein